MPELPDVEGFRAFVERHARDRRIVRARALDAWMLKASTPGVLARRLRGRRVTGTDRRGKVLFVFTDEGPDAPVLALHFGMTGHPVVESSRKPLHRWDRLVLTLDDGNDLRYRNARRLGSIRLVARAGISELLWPLGPDPLDVPASWLGEALARRRGPVKAVLLDQGFLAGIGNIYADEALFEAGLRPDRPANALGPDEVRRLHRAIRSTLRKGIAANLADTIPALPLAGMRGEASRARPAPGLTSAPCPRCARPLATKQLGGRTAYYCESCQR